MTTIRDVLQRADPIRHERPLADAARAHLRRSVLGARGDVVTWVPETTPRQRVLVVAMAALVIGLVAVSLSKWSSGTPSLHAAVRFEVRLAEDRPAPGLREARVLGSPRVVYLHDAVIVTNTDIAESRVVTESGGRRFDIAVEFTPHGAKKIERATAGHLGRPVAILIDGTVVMAPTLRGPIRASAVITGGYTKDQAVQLVEGMRLR